jgi:hypothetical protein
LDFNPAWELPEIIQFLICLRSLIMSGYVATNDHLENNVSICIWIILPLHFSWKLITHWCFRLSKNSFYIKFNTKSFNRSYDIYKVDPVSFPATGVYGTPMSALPSFATLLVSLIHPCIISSELAPWKWGTWV